MFKVKVQKQKIKEKLQIDFAIADHLVTSLFWFSKYRQMYPFCRLIGKVFPMTFSFSSCKINLHLIFCTFKMDLPFNFMNFQTNQNYKIMLGKQRECGTFPKTFIFRSPSIFSKCGRQATHLCTQTLKTIVLTW